MADLGVKVELRPVVDKSLFEDAVKDLKLPVNIDADTLTKNISAAIMAAEKTKLNVSVNTTNITKQITDAIKAASNSNIVYSGDGGNKSKKNSTKNSGNSKGKSNQQTEAERQLKQAERKVAGLTQSMQYLR